MRVLVGIWLFFTACSHPEALEVNLIPKPQYLDLTEGTFIVNEETGSIVAEGFQKEFRYFQKIINQTLEGGDNWVVLEQRKGLEQEEFYLNISADTLKISSSTSEGIMRGIQTLRQLIPNEGKVSFQALSMHDFPRFEWRGMLLDCCRHFMDKDFVKRYIDLLAYHKMNVLHWHLTEDQGWRIAIDQYPKLTEIGAWRKGQDGQLYGGFYTKDDVREIVSYATERHIMVVPEIELPGHALAALSSYPELSCTGGPFEVETSWGVFKDIYCAGNDSVFFFLENVLTEVMDLFPSPYLHIGGDEAPKYRWEHCAKCQKRITDKGLDDEHELQSYFIQRIEKFLNTNGRQLIGWDEILEGGLAPSATVQSWRGMEGGIAAAQSGHDAIMSPTSHCYFDYGLDATDLQQVYHFEPVPASLTAEDAKHILGGECNMWTEHAPQETIDSKVFPRILAMSEVLWSAADKSYPEFHERVQKHYPKLDDMGVTYGNESILITSKVELQNNIFDFRLLSESPNMRIEYQLDEGEWKNYTAPLFLTQTTHVSARGIKNDKPYGEFEQAVYLTQSTGRPADYLIPPHPNYPAQGVGNLTDGLIGSSHNFRDGFWQGFFGEDLEVVIDLGSVRSFTAVTTGFFQYNLSWIMLPSEVEYAVSDDGENYIPFYQEENSVSAKTEGKFRQEFSSHTAQQGRYVKVKAKNHGVLADWHPAAGSQSWMFVDEVRIQ